MPVACDKQERARGGQLMTRVTRVTPRMDPGHAHPISFSSVVSVFSPAMV